MERYSDISFIMSMPFEQGLNLFQKANEKNIEQRAWERWLVDYSKMTEENFVPFPKYLQILTQPKQNADNRSDDEIIEDAENILNMMKRT